MSALQLSSAPGGVRLRIRVMPRSPRSKIDGIRNGSLIVRVTAPPVEGAANAAVIALLAETLGVPRRAIRLVAGDTARDKTVVIAGVSEQQIRQRFDPPSG
jgi:uncharacterized protein (TIGR00251 family)